MVVADRGLCRDLRYVNALTAGVFTVRDPTHDFQRTPDRYINSGANDLRNLSAAED